jgi:RNA polymerase sigma factor (TIGR02999 family)
MAKGNASEDITLFLRRLRDGDSAAENLLAEAVYERMCSMARAVVGPNRNDLSIPATALASEVLLELVRAQNIDWKDREHFFRTCSRLLRRRLIDYIRASRASKRPPKHSQLPLDQALVPNAQTFDEILYVHESINQLAQVDPPLAELIELVYFGGVAISDVAKIRGVTEKTIDRHLELARKWLGKNMSEGCPSPLEKPASVYKG